MDAKIERVQSAAAMQRFALRFTCSVTCLVACLGVITGCGHDASSTAAQAPEQYRSDIANLCDVVARSGADKLPPGERAPTIATWLGGNLRTQEAHDYLIAIQPLVGDPKAAALEAEAARVGLVGCALAAEWRTR